MSENIIFGFLTGSDIDLTLTQNGKTVRGVQAEWAVLPDFAASAGRINVLPAAFSNVSGYDLLPREDGTWTLDLRDEWQAKTIPALDGSDQIEIAVAPRQQKDGWSAGEHYWLPVDPASNRMIFEPGRNHLTLHFSGRAGAYTLAMVAAEVGVAAGAITLAWLRANPQYGSQAKPLAEEVAIALLPGNQPSDKLSLWLLFERGYSYTTLGTKRYMRGQSPLHPLLFGAWGTGARPKTATEFNFAASTTEHVVFQDIHFEGRFAWLGGRGLICDGTLHNGESPVQNMDGVTFHDAKLLDIWHDAPALKSDGTPFVFDDGDGLGLRWDAYNNRMSSVYGASLQGLFFDGVMFDVGGYHPDYDHNQSAAMPHPPSMFSHAAYISAGCRDVMARETIFSRGASKGFDLRPGGYAIDCLMIDNEIPAPSLGGNYSNAGAVGEYTLFLGNVVTVAGHKRIAGGTGYSTGAGAYNWGLDSLGREGVLIDNIIAHRSDPADPADQAKRPTAQSNYRNSSNRPLFDDTIEYRWGNSGSIQGDQRTEGLDTAVLDQTTIQKFADQARATAGSKLPDFYGYMRQQRPAEVARGVLDFFRQGFGTYVAPRNAAATASFQPDPRAEGFRWDNRLNWTTGDVPGVAHQDNVNLYGYDVKFGNHVAHVDELTSNGGRLDVVSGKLTFDVASDAISAKVHRCGQLWLGAMAENAVLEADTGGRLVFTGAANKHDLTVAGDQTEVILHHLYTVSPGKTLDLRSPRSFVGWDSSALRSMAISGTLRMSAGMTIEIEGGHPRMFPGSEIWGETSGFRAVVEWVTQVRRISGTPERSFRHVYLRDVVGTPVAGEVITGTPIRRGYSGDGNFNPNTDNHDDPQWNPTIIPTGTITEIVGAAMPKIAPFVSGIHGAATPTVNATVTLHPDMELDLSRTDLLPAGQHDLIVATTLNLNGWVPPAGVSKVGAGRLVLTKA